MRKKRLFFGLALLVVSVLCVTSWADKTLVDTVTVNSNDSTGVNSNIILEPAKEYFFVADGTYGFGCTGCMAEAPLLVLRLLERTLT